MSDQTKVKSQALKRIKAFFERNFIIIAIIIVAALILATAALTFYNKSVMENALTVKEQSSYANRTTERLLNIIRQMDISARGYALIKEDGFLFYAVPRSQRENEQVFRDLDSLFNVQNYHPGEVYDSVKKGMNGYIDLYAKMVAHLKADEKDQYIQLLHDDYGRFFFPVYDRFSKGLIAFETAVSAKADLQYHDAAVRNIMVQIAVVLVGIPTLIILIIRLRREDLRRKAMLIKVDGSNKKYLFNHGDDVSDSEDVLETSIKDLRKASDFVTQISDGNYEVRWSDMTPQIAELNKDNLVGKLIQMREQMKKVKLEDEKRLWSTEGLSNFSEIIRKYQENLSELGDQATAFLVKYLDSQQGALFVLKEDQENNQYLDMVSCYAFDKKKFVEKRVNIGDGLVGQTFLEGSTNLLKKVPAGYTSITSGLGEATPTCVLVVPLKFNESVRAIFEVAAFHEFTPAEVSFVEKAGEFIASAITSASNNETTQRLLADFKIQAEQMRAQEEELRQNMEELEATQEEMKRKERELLARLGAKEA